MKAPNVSYDDMIFEQEIDLAEVLDDVDFDGAPRALKEAIAQDIIERIVSRTESSNGVRIDADGHGRPTKLKSPYSDRYEDSLKFKAAGKNKFSVNMQLTGDMLASVDVLDIDGSVIKIGIEDSEIIPRAYNHQVGDTLPERPWFGVSRDEVESILAKYADELFEAKKRTPERQEKDKKTLKAIDFLYDDDDEGD